MVSASCNMSFGNRPVPRKDKCNFGLFKKTLQSIGVEKTLIVLFKGASGYTSSSGRRFKLSQISF